MILQEEFEKNGYKDLLTENIASKYGFDLEDIFDVNNKPEELLSIFISKQGDDLFFLLDGDLMDINYLCDQWDDRIRVFSIINKDSKSFYKLKYNIIQLIVYSEQLPDKNREGNLHITRKIIIKGDMIDKKRIVIDNDESIELPFHMISEATFAPNEAQVMHLNHLLPEDENLLNIMKRNIPKVPKKINRGVRDKSFEIQNYELIKEWLIDDNSQN